MTESVNNPYNGQKMNKGKHINMYAGKGLFTINNYTMPTSYNFVYIIR